MSLFYAPCLLLCSGIFAPPNGINWVFIALLYCYLFHTVQSPLFFVRDCLDKQSN